VRQASGRGKSISGWWIVRSYRFMISQQAFLFHAMNVSGLVLIAFDKIGTAT
jgi:hypothetical protein